MGEDFILVIQLACHCKFFLFSHSTRLMGLTIAHRVAYFNLRCMEKRHQDAERHEKCLHYGYDACTSYSNRFQNATDQVHVKDNY